MRGAANTDIAGETASPCQCVDQAVAILHAGGVIALPTDTVYGLAAALDCPAAVQRIYTLKGRALEKALPILIADASLLDIYGTQITAAARRLAGRFWPGPLTIVVTASAAAPATVLRGGSTVGLRVPDAAITRRIIAGAGGALAVTSANLSGQPEARSADEVRRLLGTLVDAIVDGGPSPAARASTVVDASGGVLRILRAGALDPNDIAAFLGEPVDG